jgi:hypothetical protein
VDDNCIIDPFNYAMCNASSCLLDSEHGPQPFSRSAQQQYYTQIEEGGRVMFQFPPDTSLGVAQIYYHGQSDMNLPRVYFYNINERYHPRLNLPSSVTTPLGSILLNLEDTQEFQSGCAVIDASIPILNLLMIAPSSGSLYVSEVNFFNSSALDEVCSGIFMPVSTTMTTDHLTTEPSDDAPTTHQAVDSTSPPETPTTQPDRATVIMTVAASQEPAG